MLDENLPTLTESAIRGLACKCPRCGKGKLYGGFLTLRPNAKSAGSTTPSSIAGDGPAVFIIMIAGAIVVAAALIVEVKYQPPFWVHAALWLPLILVTTLLPLRVDEVAFDRAAIPSQGRRGPADRPRAEMSATVERRRGVAGFGIFTLAMVALFVGLGLWQLQRRVEKHALIAALTERLAAAPAPLPQPSQWSALDAGRDEFRRVSFAATYAATAGCDGL